MSQTPENTVPKTPGSAVTPTSPKEESAITPAKQPTAQQRIDALIARQDATDAKMDAILALLTARATVLKAVVEAPVAPVAEAKPAVTAPAQAATVSVAPSASASSSSLPRWKQAGLVGKVKDRLTPTGKPELVVHISPRGTETWYYPQAYTSARVAVLALNLQSGDEVEMSGFVSTWTPTAGAKAGVPQRKPVVSTIKVLSRKADRLEAEADGAPSLADLNGAPAEAVGADRTLTLDEVDHPVASERPAGTAMQALLTQVPSAPPADDGAPAITEPNPFV